MVAIAKRHFTIEGQFVPAIGLGTWLLAGQKCICAVEQALALGYRHIDTAQDYGNESEIGTGIRNADVSRSEIFLVTKVRPSNFSSTRTIQSTHDSLKALQTDYIDLLLMHWPNPSIPLAETLSAMVKLQRAGKVKNIGVSNFSPSLVKEAARYAPIFCNQVEYHPYLSQSPLLAQSRQMRYLLTAYSPLAKGRVTNEPEIKQIAAVHNKTPEQVTLRWLVQQGIAAIPKASSKVHLRTNLNVFDFELSETQMDSMRSLDRRLRLDPVSQFAQED